MRITKLRQTTH